MNLNLALQLIYLSKLLRDYSIPTYTIKEFFKLEQSCCQVPHATGWASHVYRVSDRIRKNCIRVVLFSLLESKLYICVLEMKKLIFNLVRFKQRIEFN